jgi:hypothetical protein
MNQRPMASQAPRVSEILYLVEVMRDDNPVRSSQKSSSHHVLLCFWNA